MTPDPRLAALRACLAARLPVDAREAESVHRMLAELDRLPRPFDQHDDPVHVTASAIVVGPRGTLLLKHKRIGRWVQPGGHVEDGEDLPVAARREAEEETGLILTHADDEPRVVHVDVHPGGRGHTHLDVRYLLIGPDADPCPPPGESQDVRWFGWDEALAIIDAAVRGGLRALRDTLTAQPE